MTRILHLMPGLKERAKNLEELAVSAAFLARSVPLPFEPKAAGAIDRDAKAMLGRLVPVLEATDFSAAAWTPRCALLPKRRARNWAKWRSRCARR